VTAIAVDAGVRCLDVRTADGGCLVAQQVAAIWRWGALHGALLANDFPNGGVVVAGTFGGDVGSPFFSFAHDRVRLAARLTLDSGFVLRSERLDLQVTALTFVAGPQTWVRISPRAFLTVRVAAGGTVYLGGPFGPAELIPTVDAALGFAFPLD
jgi:hypothetical protein